jgi:hypothetical protein
MNKKALALGFGVVLVAALGGVLGFIGPSNVIGMIRYDQREEGALRIGDQAPDIALFQPSSDEQASKTKISAYIGDKPLVLIFGSFT